MFGHFCVLDNVPVFVFVQTVMEWSHVFDPSVTEWPCLIVMCFEIIHVHWEYQGPDVVPGQVLAVRLCPRFSEDSAHSWTSSVI